MKTVSFMVSTVFSANKRTFSYLTVASVFGQLFVKRLFLTDMFTYNKGVRVGVFWP